MYGNQGGGERNHTVVRLGRGPPPHSIASPGLAFLRAVYVAETDTLRVGVVQNLDGVAVEDGDDGPSGRRKGDGLLFWKFSGTPAFLEHGREAKRNCGGCCQSAVPKGCCRLTQVRSRVSS